MSGRDWINWRIHGWAKLNRTCEACGKDHADIEFIFLHDRSQIGRSWHWDCLPPELRQYQSNDEAAMWKAAQTPPGL